MTASSVTYRAVAPIAREWDALADRAGAAPFFRPGWAEAWLRAFAPGCEPVIVACRDGEALTGVIVLLAGHAALSGACNWHSPVYGAVTDGPEAATALAAGVLSERASRLDLNMLDSADPFLAELRRQRQSQGRSAIERPVAEQPFVDLTAGREAYEATLQRKHRKEIGRLRRRLEAEGTVSLHFEDGRERLDELLEEGFRIEGSGWKADRGSAISSHGETAAFYADVARWAASRGELRLAFLRLDGRAIAFDLCIEAGGVAYALKGGFDAEYRRFGPGVLLTYESLVRAFELGLRSYEFLGAADQYKLAWTDRTRSRTRLQVFSASPLGHAQLAAWRYGRPIAKRAVARLGRS